MSIISFVDLRAREEALRSLQVKISFVEAHLDWVAHFYGAEGSAMLAAVIHQPLERVTTDGWMSLEALIEIDNCIIELFDARGETALAYRELGRHAARAILPSRVATGSEDAVHLLLNEAASALEQSFSFASMRYEVRGARRADVRHEPIRGVPEICELWFGFFEYCLAASRALAPRIRHLGGEPEQCAYVLRWA